MRLFLTFCLLGLALLRPSARAEDLDAETMKALEQTQNVLRTPALRDAQPASKDPSAKAVQAQIQALGGTPQDQEQIYQIAADVMGTLAKDAKGDPDQMQKILEQAMKDPAAFGNSLTPQQQQQIRELAKKFPQQPPGSAAGAGKLP